MPEYDLDHPPLDEWSDEQDRSEWFEEAAHHWRGRALAPQFVYIVNREGELDVFADVGDAEEAGAVLGKTEFCQEQVVFPASREDPRTREFLEELRRST